MTATGNNSRAGGFLMDFTSYPKLTWRIPWPDTKGTDRISGNQLTATGKILPFMWQSNSENPPPDLLQGSSSRTGDPFTHIPSGECFVGVSNSSCALSLLSNQPWGSRNQPFNLGVHNLLNTDGTPMVQAAGTNGEAISQFSSNSWGLKCNETGSSSHEMPPDLGLTQISHPANSQYHGEFELAQQGGRQYLLEAEHSRAYDSCIQNMHWSL
ncbi:unnamed protein product [Ilex paraguariensis]|uniref:Uncharacterized protein n=1 Tax=Ilex paraguariensis TaxID=185542 RepID=A0ABC8UKJ9_9AQUA